MFFTQTNTSRSQGNHVGMHMTACTKGNNVVRLLLSVDTAVFFVNATNKFCRHLIVNVR